MSGQLNIMRREAMHAASQTATVRIATVTSYDPNNYAAKVLIQPEGYETGFLPVTSPWTGNGWGMFCPPTPGDVVDVHFQEGGKQAGFVALRHYGDQFRPLPVPSGEFWVVDKLGNYFKFSGGKVLLNGHTEIDVTTPTINITTATANVTASGSVNVTAPTTNVNGNLIVTGNITATGDIYDLGGARGTVAHIRSVYDSHTHNDPQGGAVAVPNQLL